MSECTNTHVPRCPRDTLPILQYWKWYLNNQCPIPPLLTRDWDQKYLDSHWDQERNIITVAVWTQLMTLCFNMCLSRLAFLLNAPSQWSHWNQCYTWTTMVSSERNFIYTGNTFSVKKKITPIYFTRVFPKSSITTHHLGLNNLVVKSLRIFYLELTLLAVYVAKVALQVWRDGERAATKRARVRLLSFKGGILFQR